jgi:predicted nucleic acid-binding protein
LTVLPDTSIWVDYLRTGTAGSATALDDLLAQESVVVCGPVLGELLAGTPSERREELWHALEALSWAELDRSAWRRVGEVAHDLRAAGLSVPLTDLAIAVAAVSAGASVWTRDDDFERIRSVLPELELTEL